MEGGLAGLGAAVCEDLGGLVALGMEAFFYLWVLWETCLLWLHVFAHLMLKVAELCLYVILYFGIKLWYRIGNIIIHGDLNNLAYLPKLIKHQLKAKQQFLYLLLLR